MVPKPTMSNESPAETNTTSRGLSGGREFWQTTTPFDPSQTLDSWQTRYEQGKALRGQTPRESHAAWSPASNRTDPVATVLASNAGREESLVPLRMGRMAASPFAFLRGAAAVMAGDLSHTPVSGPQVHIDGDAHINNFGLYGTPQRDVVIEPFEFWGWACGALLARTHARTGDIVRIAGYIGNSDTFATALAGFAEAYGDQTEHDHAALVTAIGKERVEALQEES